MNFKEKVQSMTASEIILTMVDSLKNPVVNVEMHSFGGYSEEKLLGLIPRKVCYGCAATNTICKISGVKLNFKNINNVHERSEALNTEVGFLDDFEDAINYLRMGDIESYNEYAEKSGFANIQNNEELLLPEIQNGFTNEDLSFYVDLAKYQIL